MKKYVFKFKIVFFMMLITMMIISLTSCDSNVYKENEWFSDEKLEVCDVPDFPEIDYCDYINVNDEDIYVNINPYSYDYVDYMKIIYSYLLEKNFKYIGTRGEQANTLAGTLTSYYFKPVDYYEDFICNQDGHNWIFVYSDGEQDENGTIIFNIILIDRTQSEIKYKGKKFEYNTIIRLRHKSELPLNGYYILEEE